MLYVLCSLTGTQRLRRPQKRLETTIIICDSRVFSFISHCTPTLMLLLGSPKHMDPHPSQQRQQAAGPKHAFLQFQQPK